MWGEKRASQAVERVLVKLWKKTLCGEKRELVKLWKES